MILGCKGLSFLLRWTVDSTGIANPVILFYFSFECCRHVNNHCETVELFGKICERLPRICSELGHELPKRIVSSEAPMSSHHAHPSLTHSITVTVGPSGVNISSAPVHMHNATASHSGSIHASMGASMNGSIVAASMNVSEVVSAISSQIASLNASQGESLSASQVATVISSLIASQAASLSSSEAASIFSSQIASLSASQVATVISSLVASQAASLSSSEAASIFSSQIASLVSSQGVSLASSQAVSIISSENAGASASLNASHATMSWSAVQTSAFGTMVASINPSSLSHFPSSSPAVVGPPWWSSYNLSESMESWLSFIKNNSMCGHGKKFCGLNLQCIPEDQPCTVYLSNDAVKNLSNTAWCVNCSSEEYFCPLFMQCINVNESCSYENVDKWINSNASTGLTDLACGENKTFSFATMECVPGNYHHHGHECGHGEVFCPYSASCKNKTDCAPFRELNYTEALKNDSFGRDDNIF